MAAIDRQAVILDAIDSLRRRKARPDLERICHMVGRKYGLTDVEVITELDRLVDEEIVIKVDYKGNTSYRNAAKWCKSRLGGHQLNSNDATRSILAAIEKLTVLEDSEQVLEDADCLSSVQPKNDNNALKGASLEEIVKFFAEENPDTKFTRSYLEEALKREVGSRRLYISPTNKYVLAKYAVTYEEGEAFQLKRGPRPPKRKRIKKTHGPDFEQEPLIKTSMWDQRCDYCSLPASCNKFGAKEELLVCKDCTLKVHPSCMKYTRQLAERSRLSPWQCIDCKTCHVCNDAGDADTLLFCDSCDKGYHMACHNPIVEEKPLGKWVCELCASEDMEIGSNFTDEDSVMSSEASVGSNTEEKNNSAENGSSQTSDQVTPDVATPNQSRVANLPVQSAQANTSSSPPEISLPTHPAHWSLDDVVKFLQEKGFKEEADTFKDQEIDGHALLLLRRSDVLTGLSFKLGPALKIYQIVSKLQLSQAKDSPVSAKTKSSLQTTTSKASSSSCASSTKSKPSTSSTKAPQPKKPKKEASTPKPSSPPNRSSETAKKTTQPQSATRAKDTSPKTLKPQPAKSTLAANSPPKSKGSPANSASQSENSTPTPPDVSPKTEAKSPRKSSTSSRTTP